MGPRSSRSGEHGGEGEWHAWLSSGWVHGSLEESEGQIVDSSGKSRGWRDHRGNEHGGGRSEAASAGVVAGGMSGIKDDIGSKAERSGSASDGKVGVERTTVQGIGAKGDDGIQIAKHG